MALERVTARYAVAITVSYLLISGSHIVLAELVPKSIAIRIADRSAIWSAKPLRFFHRLFFPALWLLTLLSNGILRLFGLGAATSGEHHSEQELRIILDQSQERGLLSFRRLLFMENVFDLGALTEELAVGEATGNVMTVGALREARALACLVAGDLADHVEADLVAAADALEEAWPKRIESRLRRAALLEAMGDLKPASAVIDELRTLAGDWNAGARVLALIDHRAAALALDAGAEDVKVDEKTFEVITTPHDFEAVKKALTDAKIESSLAEVTFVPQSYVKLEEKNAEQMLKLMEILDDHDDIQKVHANFDIPEAIMEKVAAAS